MQLIWKVKANCCINLFYRGRWEVEHQGWLQSEGHLLCANEEFLVRLHCTHMCTHTRDWFVRCVKGSIECRQVIPKYPSQQVSSSSGPLKEKQRGGVGEVIVDQQVSNSSMPLKDREERSWQSNSGSTSKLVTINPRVNEATHNMALICVDWINPSRRISWND